MNYKYWKLPIHMDDRGGLAVAEWKDLPFLPRRIYFLFDTTQTRGEHAHRNEKEVFICVKGSFKAKIHDGKKFHTYKMNKVGQALYTANMVWHEFSNFSRDAVMLAISSIPYRGKNEYILDFKEFLKLCRKKSS